ncbi:MAG: tetraacyldisaccharide 4'-kinase, partial [Bacteroidales bacterium]
MSIDKYILFPYYLVLRLRNRMYDKGSIKSRSYKVPVICVGNVTVGGTGKTPHTEMLISLLKDNYNVAVVSRGYGRKGKKFKEVQEDDNYENVGDEPLQIKRKFPDIKVLVDVNRVEAIDLFLQESGISNDLSTADS